MRWKRGRSHAGRHRPARPRRRRRRWRSAADRPVGGGLGLVGVIVFLRDPGARRRRRGPSRFARGLRRPGGRSPAGEAPIPASQDPDRDLRDFSAYVFTDAQDTLDRDLPRGRAGPTSGRSSCSTAAASTRAGCGPRPPPSGRSTAPPTSASTSTSPSTATWSAARRARATSRGRTSSRTRSATTSSSQLGTSGEVRRAPARTPATRNELSVRLELQADCYAGVWAHAVFEAGAARAGRRRRGVPRGEAVGDDRLQRSAGRRRQPGRLHARHLGAAAALVRRAAARRASPAPATRSARTRSDRRRPWHATTRAPARRSRPPRAG